MTESRTPSHAHALSSAHVLARALPLQTGGLLRTVGAVVLGLALLVATGCTSSTRQYGEGCGCPPCPVPCPPCGLRPTDMPKDPDPCVKYCRVWVPPVYRNVPKLEIASPGYMQSVDRTVMQTHFVERQVKPARGYHVSAEPALCQQTGVEVTPGGWRWQDTGCGCWKYCYTPPAYNWCTKTVKEEGISYCNEEPAEYETVAYTCPKKTCVSRYVPQQYRTVWVRECVTPGHWQWVAKDDACGTCFPHRGETRTFPVAEARKRSTGGCTPTCARCN